MCNIEQRNPWRTDAPSENTSWKKSGWREQQSILLRVGHAELELQVTRCQLVQDRLLRGAMWCSQKRWPHLHTSSNGHNKRGTNMVPFHASDSSLDLSTMCGMLLNLVEKKENHIIDLECWAKAGEKNFPAPASYQVGSEDENADSSVRPVVADIWIHCNRMNSGSRTAWWTNAQVQFDGFMTWRAWKERKHGKQWQQ